MQKLSFLLGSGLVLALGLSACSNEVTTPSALPASATVAPASDVSAVANTPPLPVYKIRTVNEPYPPFSIFHGDDNITGLEVDVLNAIGKNQGFHAEYVPYVWEVIFKDLKKDGIAMVGGGLATDDMDLEVLTVSKPYMRAPDCVATTSEKNLKIWNKKKIALVAGDEEDEYLIDEFGVSPKKIIHVKSQYQALQYVRDGTVTATMSDCHVLKYYMKQSLKDNKFIIKELDSNSEDQSYDLVFGVRKDETELLNKINKGIDNLKKNGELDKILQKWR